MHEPRPTMFRKVGSEWRPILVVPLTVAEIDDGETILVVTPAAQIEVTNMGVHGDGRVYIRLLPPDHHHI